VLIDGYPNASHRAFSTFDDAKQWLETQGCPQFHFHVSNDVFAGQPAPRPDEPGFYAVANGRHKGVYWIFQSVIFDPHTGNEI
jgi:viroplasmin and RNaseH domain-containing protein